MLPVARGANGQPPIPPTEASKTRHAGFERRVRVREAGVARVVQVDADGGSERHEAADEVVHLARHADADRVRNRDLVRAGRHDPRCELRHAARVDGALERTAEGDPDRHRRADPVGRRARDDPLGGGDALLDRCARVALVELLRRGEGEVHLVETAVTQPLVAALVQGEARVDDTLAPRRSRRRPPPPRPSAAPASG